MSQKKSPAWNFLRFFPKRLEIFSPNFTRLRWTANFYLIYLQLWRSYAILSATTIMYSKCPPSTETHTGWSHLIWHNFVTVGDNWIKICTLAYIWTFNRRVKFGLKIPNCLRKMSENASVRFGRCWTFCAHDLNWVVTLNNFVKVAGNWIKIRSLASIGTRNRHVKFGWKIPNRFGNIATSRQGGFFDSHCTLATSA